MPQMNKDGKFVFGESEVHSDGRVQLPPQAVDEYPLFIMTDKGTSVQRFLLLFGQG